MNKENFLAGMKSDIHFEPQERSDILNKCLKSCNWKTKATVAIEELAELQQALSKQIRGCGDRDNLLEEMADVAIVYCYIKKIFGLTEEELDKAIDVKIERERGRLTMVNCADCKYSYIEDIYEEWCCKKDHSIPTSQYDVPLDIECEDYEDE